MKELQQLLERANELTKFTFSPIEKDLLLSYLRKSYELALQIETSQSLKVSEEHKSESDSSTIAIVAAAPVEEKVEIVQANEPEPVLPDSPIIIADTIVQVQEEKPEPLIEPQPEPVILIPEVIEAEPAKLALESIEVALPSLESITKEAEEQNSKLEKAENLPVVKPMEKISLKFDELVEKVKDQPTFQKPLVGNNEPDDDEPFFFSDIKLDHLFDPVLAAELSDKLGNSKIDDLTKAMGLNERIFTMNELFGGDNNLFNQSLKDLDNCANYAQARSYIESNLVQQYNWMNESKFRKAKEFIKLVRRRFS